MEKIGFKILDLPIVDPLNALLQVQIAIFKLSAISDNNAKYKHPKVQ